MPSASAPAAAANSLTHPTEARTPRTAKGLAPLAPEQHPAELVLLAGLEDGQHLISHLERRRPDGDLRLFVAHDRDQPGALRQLEILDALARDRRVLVDLHLDDLEVLLAQLEQVNQVVLRHLVLDERHDERRVGKECRSRWSPYH